MVGKLKISLRLFAALSLVWLLVIVALSSCEFLFNMSSPGIRAHGTSLWLYKVLNDVIFWLRIYVWFLALFLCGCFLSVRLAAWMAIGIIALLVLMQALLVKYFSTALVPLGADLYGYSWTDIKQTVGASGGLTAGTVVLVVMTMSLLVALLSWVFRRFRLPLVPALLFPGLSLAVIIVGQAALPRYGNFQSDFETNLVLDKPDYFFRQSWGHFFPDEQETDIYADYYAGETAANTGAVMNFQYTDEAAYPFFHGDSTADVLSAFFESHAGAAAPNIVILLVEGLGRAFTNEGAYLGNFTPFIDSLSGHSLYWKNFLSEGGRTFAVLPSVLASLPFGKNGFLELADRMPSHLSLLNVLKKNGYHTSFYYGGDAHFDNMDVFLQKNGIDELNDEKSFPAGYTKLPSNNGFTWGYNDAELFRHYLDTRPAGAARRQLSVILTVSTHSPFKINEPDKYDRLFENRMSQLGFDETEKKEHRGFKDQYASILYTDDALRGFFAAYSQRADFKNTIFLITGDHRMPEIPMRTKIDRYHVPLIVYSPLLKRPAEFLSVSTHFDITPSVLAFLARSYGILKPAGSQWMGTGLDTARGFRNIHAYPMIQTKTDQVDFIMDEYHLNGPQVFRLSPDMNEEAVSGDGGKGSDDDGKRNKERLENAFDKYRRRNARLAEGTKLIPDSLQKKYP